MSCCLFVLGLIPKHGKHLFSCAALLDMIPSMRNCGRGFVTQVLHTLELLCKVECEVSQLVIGVQAQVDTCIPVDTCMYE